MSVNITAFNRYRREAAERARAEAEAQKVKRAKKHEPKPVEPVVASEAEAPKAEEVSSEPQGGE